MKRIGFLLLFLLFPTLTHALTIERMNIAIDIASDGKSHWTVEIDYDNYTSRTNYYVFGLIENVHVYGEKGNELKCTVGLQGIGTLINCRHIHEKHVTYTFTAHNLVNPVGSAKRFAYTFPVTSVMRNLEIEVRLPFGAVIIDKEKLADIGLKPFVPEWGEVASDGRQIFVRWKFEKPSLGSAIEVSVIYEQFLEASHLMIIVSFLTILFLVFLAVSFRKKSRIKEILPVLNENERKVMQFLLAQKKKETDQRKIARELGFSKPKLSRIIKDLEERGLIEVTRRGRTNRIKLAFSKKKK